nr:tRNA lysidine(34) synthetase TilS [Rhodospirillum rubrum]
MVDASGVIDAEAFAVRMAALGPFEPEPAIAVGVSGGVDSLTLLAFAARWAAERGGRCTAVCFDHGLRAASAGEARLVETTARSLGAEAVVLRWAGPPPPSGVQEAARRARLEGLLGWCAGAGVLHLLLAHHRDDQAETVLQRLGRGSGADGLAAMAALSSRGEARILRPFLEVPRAAIEASARRIGLVWAEDPSNHDPHYDRARLRAAAGPLDQAGLSAKALAASAARLGDDRAFLARHLSALLAGATREYGEGWLVLDRDALAASDPWAAARALAWAAGAIAGGERAADPRPIAALLATPPAPGQAHALAGCLWQSKPRGALVLCRECRGLDRRREMLPPGESLLWDGRWLCRAGRGGVSVSALGTAGWQKLAPALAGDRRGLPPTAALPALPIFYGESVDGKGDVFAVPSLGLWGYGYDPGSAFRGEMPFCVDITYHPILPLVPLGLRVGACCGL